MKRNEQLIVGALAVVALIAGFWLLVLSPKRNQAAQLQGEVDQLQASLSQAQQDVAAGEHARKSFPLDYRRMVVLGKAVPADSEQTSLLVQLQGLADRSGVEFQGITLGNASTSAAVAVPSASSSSTSSTDTSTPSDSSSTSSSSSASASSTAALPSEASVSTLPIGATVGPAGLPVMPYELTFNGDFFQIANFMAALDGFVHVRSGLPDVRGRLLTVDSFTLSPTDEGSTANPTLTATLSVTTFLTPPDQGITAGASPSGPADSTSTLTSSSTSTDASSTDSTSTESTAP